MSAAGFKDCDRLNVIMQLVCAEFGRTQENLFAKGRAEAEFWPRYALYWLGAKLTGFSQGELARILNVDRTLFCKGLKRIEERMEAEPAFRVQMEWLLERLHERFKQEAVAA